MKPQSATGRSPVEVMEDYSGKLRPGLKMQDFSKDALIRLWQASGKLYVGLDGLWYSLIRERDLEKKWLASWTQSCGGEKPPWRYGGSGKR